LIIVRVFVVQWCGFVGESGAVHQCSKYVVYQVYRVSILIRALLSMTEEISKLTRQFAVSIARGALADRVFYDLKEKI